MREPFFVDRIGHRWATQAASFKTAALAMEHAKRSCGEAMTTTVYDCSTDPSGQVLAVFNRYGRRLDAEQEAE